MKKTILLTALVVLCTAGVEAQTNTLQQSRRIDSFLLKEMNAIGIPGLAVAIVENGKSVYQRTFGKANLEWDAPVTARTAFQIASVTKLFTSTLVLKWVQEGKIHLEDHVLNYFPDGPQSWKSIEVQHLLSHQSGIPWPSSIGGFIGMKASGTNKPPTKEEIYKDMRDSALTFVPGTKESYINGDHFILQMILEKIGGKPFPRLLEEEVLLPLNMYGSGYDLELRELPFQVMKVLPQKTQLYTKGKTSPYILKGFYNSNSYTAAALYLSIQDAIKWAIALDKGVFIKGPLLDSIKAPMPLKGSFTKLGWISETIYGQECFGHSGGPGLGHILRLPDKKLTIIVLNNYADLYPYLATALVGICTNAPQIKEENARNKTLNRGFDGKLE